MTRAPFLLQENLIVYGDNKQADQIPQTRMALEEIADGNLMGVMAIIDDDSVHADYWECHPDGDEVLLVLEGRLTVVIDGEVETTVTLEENQAFIVPRGKWHRLKVLEPGKLLFFTPVAGGELRPSVPACQTND